MGSKHSEAPHKSNSERVLRYHPANSLGIRHALPKQELGKYVEEQIVQRLLQRFMVLIDDKERESAASSSCN